jgi:6-phosphofructokinase 1
MLCEVMGRNAGWIATRAGIAGGGDVILIPEIPYDIQKVCGFIANRARQGKNYSIVVVAEGARPRGGTTVSQGRSRSGRLRLGGISYHVARDIERASGIETRVVVLGHLQRGGTPTAQDRWLANGFGVHAVELAVRGRWGQMVSKRGMKITHIPIADAVGIPHRVDPHGQDVHAAEAVGCSFGR